MKTINLNGRGLVWDYNERNVTEHLSGCPEATEAQLLSALADALKRHAMLEDAIVNMRYLLAEMRD